MMVLIFSGHANASGQVRREVERAISQGMTVLPIRVQDVRPEGAMEFALGNTHWLDAFTPPVERQLEKLARSVKTLLANDTESSAAPEPELVKPIYQSAREDMGSGHDAETEIETEALEAAPVARQRCWRLRRRWRTRPEA